jgi:hypothetical protein
LLWVSIGSCIPELINLLCGHAPKQMYNSANNEHGSAHPYGIAGEFMFLQAIYLIDYNSKHGDGGAKTKKCPEWPVKAKKILMPAMLERDDGEDLENIACGSEDQAKGSLEQAKTKASFVFFPFLFKFCRLLRSWTSFPLEDFDFLFIQSTEN